jgi:hypothetical protein
MSVRPRTLGEQRLGRCQALVPRAARRTHSGGTVVTFRGNDRTTAEGRGERVRRAGENERFRQADSKAVARSPTVESAVEVSRTRPPRNLASNCSPATTDGYLAGLLSETQLGRHSTTVS